MWKERMGYFILVHFVFSTNFTAIVKLQLWSSRTPEIMHKQHYKWKAMNVSDERGEKRKTMRKKANEHYFLRMLSTFYFFPVISNFLRRFFYSCLFAFLLVTTRKHHATVKQENRYMKPESTETHFGYLFHFVWIFFFILISPCSLK